MGEATYYLKATFDDSASASAALPRIKSLIEEGIKAYEWWQEHRHMEDSGKKRARFWTMFRKKFPRVYDYLGSIGLADGECNNELAGNLDFGGYEEEVNDALFMDDVSIRYSATVWHFANWDGFATYIEDKFGAVSTAWVSDEYMDPYEYLDAIAAKMPRRVTASSLIRSNAR